MQRIAFPVFLSRKYTGESSMQKKAKMSLGKRHNLTGWAFLIPAALLIFIFCFYPMVQALILSFSKKGTGGSTFVGLANYQRILKDKTFQQCLFNTVFYFFFITCNNCTFTQFTSRSRCCRNCYYRQCLFFRFTTFK